MLCRRCPAYRRYDSVLGFPMEIREPVVRMLREAPKWRTHKGLSADAAHWGGAARSNKWQVYRAYELVKANKGAAGVDNQSLADFECNLKDNLYKLWNRMSSGCYFPPPVKAVAIPKKSGGERVLAAVPDDNTSIVV